MSRLARAILIAWAIGSLFSEGLQQACLWAGLIVAVVCVFRSGFHRLETSLRPLLVVVAAFIVWQFLSPVVAMLAGNSEGLPGFSRASRSLDLLAPLVVFVLAGYGVPWRALIWILGVGWIGELLVSLYQSWVRWPIDHLGPWDLTRKVRRAWENFALPGRPPRYAGVGFFFHRLRYAHAAVAMAGPALALFLAGSRRWGRKATGLGIAFTAVLFAAPLLAYTRAAFLVIPIMAAIGCGAAWAGRRRVVAIVGVGLAAMVVLAASPSWRQRLDHPLRHLVGEGDRGVAQRAGLRLIEAHPILGVGTGNYQRSALALPPDGDTWRISELPALTIDAHNLWLTVWAESGLPGLLLMVAIQLLLARALFRRWREGSPLALGGLLSWSGYQLLVLAHYLPFHSSVQLTFGLVWGLCLEHRTDNLPFRGSAPGHPGEPEPGSETLTAPRKSTTRSAWSGTRR